MLQVQQWKIPPGDGSWRGQSAGGTTLDPMTFPQMAPNSVGLHTLLHV